MKLYIINLFAALLLVSCNQGGNTINMLEDNSRWKSEGELMMDDSGLLISGEYQELYYVTGVFRTFENFELSAEIKTDSGGFGSIAFHTGNRDPKKGYEVIIDNSPVGNWDKLQKTGSLSYIRNVNYNMVNDQEWFDLKIRVVENHIEVFVNNLPVIDYIEPEMAFRTSQFEKRKIGSGTIALRSNYGSTSMKIRKLEIKKIQAGETIRYDDPVYARQITMLNIRNLPVVDYHVHIKGDLTIDQALDISAGLGVNYGIAANCGLKFPIQTNEELRSYLESIEGLPIFKAMQAEGREWVDMFDPELISQFDYAFTDAMTWTNSNGTRMRLWIPEETEVGDPQDFMDQLVNQIELIAQEPISIYVNPTFLPDEIADQYDELWTDERISRVIKALKDNNVALEINNIREIPGKKFISLAQEEGVKFAMGTNNNNAENLGRLDWSLKMISEFNIQPGEMFLPGQK